MKIIFRTLIIFSLTGVLSPAFAQSNRSNEAPELFQPAVISIASATTYRPTFTPDGKTVYYTIEAGSGEYVILQSERRGKRWTQPRIASFSGRHSDAEAFLSPDGAKMVFASKRPLTGDKPKTDYDLWLIERQPGGRWSEPRHLGGEINTDARELYPSLAADGTLYFVRSDDEGNDIWRSDFAGGRYLPAQRLPPPVNTDRREAGVYVAPDQSFMLFESNREGSLGGTDLFISFRRGENWTEPKNLGAPFSSQFQETSPVLSPEGKKLYFASNRILPGATRLGADLTYQALLKKISAHGNGKWHIYSVDFDLADFAK